MIWLLRTGIAIFVLGTLAFAAASFSPIAVHRDGFLVAAAICLLTASALYVYRRRIPNEFEGLCRDLKRERNWTKQFSKLVQDPWTLWPFLTVFLLGLVFRLLELYRPVRQDEAFTYLGYASQPLYQALSDYSQPNNHLFHTLLVFLSTQLLGNTLTGLRLPALLGGLAMMPAVFAVTGALYNRRAALVAMALVACAPPFIEYSVNARGYTWQTVFVLLTAWFACRIGEEGSARSDWLGLVLAIAIAVYTIPTSVIPCAAIALWLMLIRWQSCGWNGLLSVVREMIPVFLAVLVLVMLLYLPPMIASGPEAIVDNRYIHSMRWARFLPQIPDFARTTWIRWNDGWPLALQLAVSAGFILGIVAHPKIGRQVIPLPLFVILFCVMFIFVRTTFGFSRAWLYLWAFFLITAAAGISFVLCRRLLVAGFAVLIAAFAGMAVHQEGVIRGSTETGYTPDLEKAAIWMDRHLDPKDRIVMDDAPPLAYLLRQKWPRLEQQLQFAPAPKRIVAVIAKYPDVDYGPAQRDLTSWHLRETSLSAHELFKMWGYDPGKYSEPRLVKDFTGVTIWEASRHP